VLIISRSEDAEATAKSLEGMVEGCEVMDFPQVRHDFSDTKIYWRKGAELATAGQKSSPSDIRETSKSKASDQQPPPDDTQETSESAQV
jgi:hypothetical protein